MRAFALSGPQMRAFAFVGVMLFARRAGRGGINVLRRLHSWRVQIGLSSLASRSRRRPKKYPNEQRRADAFAATVAAARGTGRDLVMMKIFNPIRVARGFG